MSSFCFVGLYNSCKGNYFYALKSALIARYGVQVTSRFYRFNWPPISCVISPLDFFLCGYLKSKVYADNPARIQALGQNLTSVIRQLPAKVCERVIENWAQWMDYLRSSRDQHLKKIIYKNWMPEKILSYDNKYSLFNFGFSAFFSLKSSEP